jgi:hypothetical protein
MKVRLFFLRFMNSSSLIRSKFVTWTVNQLSLIETSMDPFVIGCLFHYLTLQVPNVDNFDFWETCYIRPAWDICWYLIRTAWTRKHGHKLNWNFSQRRVWRVLYSIFVTLCHPVEVYRRFGQTCYIRHQDRSVSQERNWQEVGEENEAEPVRIASNPAGIRTQHLLNTILDRYVPDSVLPVRRSRCTV